MRYMTCFGDGSAASSHHVWTYTGHHSRQLVTSCGRCHGKRDSLVSATQPLGERLCPLPTYKNRFGGFLRWMALKIGIFVPFFSGAQRCTVRTAYSAPQKTKQISSILRAIELYHSSPAHFINFTGSIVRFVLVKRFKSLKEPAFWGSGGRTLHKMCSMVGSCEEP